MNAIREEIIFPTLSGEAGLVALGSTGVYEDEAPQSTTQQPVSPPYIIFFKAGGTRTDRTHDGGVARRPAYWIKVIDKATSTRRAHQIDDRIEELLSGKRFSTSAGDFFCFRDGDMPNNSEKMSGVTYKHAGGLYRFGPG